MKYYEYKTHVVGKRISNKYFHAMPVNIKSK